MSSLILLAALTAISCSKFYYAQDLRERNIVEYGWLKEMEDFVFQKKNAGDRTAQERLFYAGCFFDAEMQKGGFARFFMSLADRSENEGVADGRIAETVFALRSMTMSDRADVLQKAYARYKAFTRAGATTGKSGSNLEKVLAEYSDQYFKLSARDTYFLEGLIVNSRAFVERHIDDFYILR